MFSPSHKQFLTLRRAISLPRLLAERATDAGALQHAAQDMFASPAYANVLRQHAVRKQVTSMIDDIIIYKCVFIDILVYIQIYIYIM